MKIAVLTTDNREPFREYTSDTPWFGTAPQGLFDGFAQLPEAEVHVVSCIRQPVKSPQKLAPNIWFHSLHVPRMGWTMTCFQGCIRATRKKLQELRPDIIHGQGTERDCSLSAIFSGFPNILTIHGNMRLIAKINHAGPISYMGMSAQLEKFTLPRTAGVLCITRYTQEAVKDLARKTWVLPNAVDASFYDVKPAPDPARIILCVGVIQYRKNQNPFIKSLDALAAKTKFKVIFLGGKSESDYSGEFLKLVADRPWCEYAGNADRATLRNWFQRATMIALPSLEDNCPMVVLEAMAAGVPVLAAKVGGVPDLIDDERTGLFCDPLDLPSMSRGVERLLSDEALAQKLAGNAKQEALKRFHPVAVAKRHLEIYREVLSKSS